MSAVEQSYSVIYILFHILFHYGLSQDIEYSSLCYTVGPCCLSILYIANPKLPIHPPPTLPHFRAATSMFFMSVNLFLFHWPISLCCILDSTGKWFHMLFDFLFMTYFAQYDNF